MRRHDADLRERNGEIRDAGLADTADLARLIDGLDDIDYVGPLYPSDVPPETVELQTLETMLNNTDKNINILLTEGTSRTSSRWPKSWPAARTN